MTTMGRTTGLETSGWLAPAILVGRAAIGLALHGLAHPLRPAAITRASGRVVAR